MSRSIKCLLALILALGLTQAVQARLTQDPSVVVYYSFDAFGDIVFDQSMVGKQGFDISDSCTFRDKDDGIFRVR